MLPNTSRHAKFLNSSMPRTGLCKNPKISTKNKIHRMGKNIRQVVGNGLSYCSNFFFIWMKLK